MVGYHAGLLSVRAGVLGRRRQDLGGQLDRRRYTGEGGGRREVGAASWARWWSWVPPLQGLTRWSQASRLGDARSHQPPGCYHHSTPTRKPFMSAAFDAVLEGYRRRLADEVTLMSDLPREQFAARRDEFLLAVGEDTARFLHATVIGLGAKHIVEVGTSYGYSTLFLAQAAQHT